MNQKIIGVMGSGSVPHENLTKPLGQWIAERNFHLLTGGGSGVMSAVSRSYVSVSDRKGICIGILPSAGEQNPEKPKTGYPNPYIELPIQTHLPLSGQMGTNIHSRNHINILSSHLIIVLPGSAGTVSEARLTIRYNKPVFAFLNRADEMPTLPKEIEVYTEFEALAEKALAILT